MHNLHFMWHSNRITEIQTVMLGGNPVNGVDIVKQRDEGCATFGQPGMNAGPSTG